MASINSILLIDVLCDKESTNMGYSILSFLRESFRENMELLIRF
jgi:hypothetical protein